VVLCISDVTETSVPFSGDLVRFKGTRRKAGRPKARPSDENAVKRKKVRIRRRIPRRSTWRFRVRTNEQSVENGTVTEETQKPNACDRAEPISGSPFVPFTIRAERQHVDVHNFFPASFGTVRHSDVLTGGDNPLPRKKFFKKN